MKTILLLVHDDPGQEARLQAALDVTRAFEGHLVCLDVALMPVVMGDFYAVAGTVDLLAEESAAEAVNRPKIEARLAGEDVPWSMIDMTGPLIPNLKRAAGLADLIVVNRHVDAFPVPDMRSAVGEIVLASGRPVLAVPQDARGIDVGGRALMCWDGSEPAQAALKAAVPFLQRASAVDLIELGDRQAAVPIEDAAAYLSRYDIHALISRRPEVRHVADAILAQASSGYAYVVMGGFSHSRFREALFGGVTRKMLDNSPVPLFLAH